MNLALFSQSSHFKNRAAFRKRLLEWFATKKRDLPWRRESDPYRIWVSEVMLQQTRVDTVIGYYERFIRRYPNLKKLAESPIDDVLKIWEGLGYYARARNLHRAAQMVVSSHKGHVPHDPETFKTLPGVGDYIAPAVQSIAFQTPEPAVDANVKRVIARLLLVDTPVNHSSSHRVFHDIAEKLIETNQPGEFNQAMMELGALVCTPKDPDCPHCPVSAFCLGNQRKMAQIYPKRLPKKRIPEYLEFAAIIRKENTFLVVRRPMEGLLGGLWEFPGGRTDQVGFTENECKRQIRKTAGILVNNPIQSGNVKHVYSHFRVRIKIFTCAYVSGHIQFDNPSAFEWATREKINQLPMTGVSRKITQFLETP